jgi:hypothetical protein
MIASRKEHSEVIAPSFLAAIVIIACLGLTACSGIPIDDGATRHYVIVGFGVVSIPQPLSASTVHVSKVQAFGLTVADQPGLRFALGYASGMVAAIPPDVDDVRVEIADRPFGPVTIHANENQQVSD